MSNTPKKRAASGKKLEAVPDISTMPPVETIEMSDQDELDISALYAEEPDYHTILEVWREVLKPTASEAKKSVGGTWAARINAQYPYIKFQEMHGFRDLYFAKIAELVAILDYEIASDPNCLKQLEVKLDATHNDVHYRNLLTEWQRAVVLWEIEWDCTAPDSHLELAAISETHKFFLGNNGILGYLDNIGFEFTEDDKQELANALNEMKGGDSE